MTDCCLILVPIQTGRGFYVEVPGSLITPYMLILACSDGDTIPTSVQLESQNFWIRVRGLPPKLFNKAMGRRIGNMLGVYVDFDPVNTGDCTGNFLRIRVELGLSKPLRRWVRLDLGMVEWSKIQLEYVRRTSLLLSLLR